MESLYAISLKGWIEVRRANRAPRAIRSSLSHSPSLTIKALVWEGGEYVTSVRKGRFAALTGFTIPTGRTRKVPEDVAHKLEALA